MNIFVCDFIVTKSDLVWQYSQKYWVKKNKTESLLWICTFNNLFFFDKFDKIRFKTKNISKKSWFLDKKTTLILFKNEIDFYNNSWKG